MITKAFPVKEVSLFASVKSVKVGKHSAFEKLAVPVFVSLPSVVDPLFVVNVTETLAVFALVTNA